MNERGLLGLNWIGPIAIGAVVLVGSAYLYNLRQEVVKAKAAEALAIQQRNQAGIERDKAIAVARENENTIMALQQEKTLVNQALNDLQKAQAANQNRVQAREVIIQGQGTVPSSKALTAPVISSTITAIQEDRVRRRI